MRARLHRTTSRRWLAAAATASAALAGVGLASPAALADPEATPQECPAAYPVTELVTGTAVTGRTVTTGTQPEGFGGSVLGVLEDGIAADVDMVLVDLDSPTIDRVGIWSGMSGSPVYAADGRLIGAVAYSLGSGPSTVAGVTPAAEMYRLLTSSRATTVAPRSDARLSATLQRSVARTGAPAGSTTMSRLRVPVGMSGLGAARVASLAPALNSQGVHLADIAAGAPSTQPIPVTAGGNMAASMAHGTITAAAVGTATAVCGGEVVGFGHPMSFSGAATMSLHGATATHIQDDPTFSGFKVANLGAPIGTVDRDRLAGIRGAAGALPQGYDVTTTATTQGAGSRTARTNVTVGPLIPEIAFSNTVAAQDGVMDRLGAGQATTTWTVKGLRRSGAPFTYTRSNRYADPADISLVTAAGLADELMALQDNPGEVVRLTSVEAATTIEDDYESYRIAKVQYLRGKTWVTMPSRTGAFKQGSTLKLRVTLTSREADPRVVDTSVTVPTRTAGRSGVLVVSGGGADMYYSEEFFDEEEFFFDEEPAPSDTAFPTQLKEMEAAPKNDEVVTSLQFRASGAAGKERVVRADADRVVGGIKSFRVRATR